MPMPSSRATCSMIAVLPIPGAPTKKIGLWCTEAIESSPASSLFKYASTVSFTCCFAETIFIVPVLSRARG